MKKLLLSVMVALASFRNECSDKKGRRFVDGKSWISNQLWKVRFAGTGTLCDSWQSSDCADLTFFFPKDKVTGLDVNVNFHYVFNFSKDGQGFSVYPLAGIGMQNNFYGKQKVEVDGVTTELDRSNTTKFAFNLGGGITLPLSERSYLNAEAKFMFANDDNVVIMLG